MTHDPRHPNRPEHDDFWLMAEAIQDLDAASEDGIDFQRIIGPVDMESLIYMAQQRALRVGMKLTGTLPRHIQAAVLAAWTDGFMAGARFHALKQRRGSK